MSQELWTAIDSYLNAAVLPNDPVMEATLAASASAGLPSIQVARNQGKLLHLLARLRGAQRILEIGTLGGYSTLWLARALPARGQLVTLELDPTHAAVARENFRRAALEHLITLHEGPALTTLARLTEAGEAPFDLVFIDADKPNILAYFEHALALTRPGAVIIVDNIVRRGAVTDATSPDPAVQGVRQFLARLAAEPRITATALQTVGDKGHDGFVLAQVVA
jgi:predicted O-methyltransferase YrrM